MLDADVSNPLAWLVLVTWVILILLFIGLILFYWDYPEQKATVERCERQHRQLMSGDDRGFYGDYPPT